MRSFRVRNGAVDLETRKVRLGSDTHRLTPLEVKLLERLAASAPEPVARDALLADVWGYDARIDTQVLEQAIRRVRRKVEVRPSAPCHVLTEHGVGYRLLVGRGPAVPNTPAPRNRFVGRAAELEQIDHWFEEQPEGVLTVVGLGGVGKTRLVLEWAHRAALPTPTWFADLSQCTTGDEGIERVLDAVGGHPRSHVRPGLDDVERALEVRSGLLILDNVEHLVGDVAGWVDHLVQRLPGCRFLATSREPLRIDAERVLALGPLTGAEAVGLWQVRSAASGVAPPLDEHDVRRITDSVDRIPLAIELAAAHATVPGLRALLASRRRRTANPRHETLSACLDWSWRSLHAEEQTLLATATVFRGGFTEPALRALAPGSVDVANGLQRLVDASLVHIVDPTARRFDMYDLVRVFTAAQQPRPTAALEHARFFAAYGTREARRALGADPELVSARLDEADNLVAAARYSVDEGHGALAAGCVLALATLWIRIKPAVTLGWVREVRAMDVDPSVAGELGLYEGAICTFCGQWDQAEAILRHQLQHAPEEDTSFRGRLLIELGNVHWHRDELQRALERYEAAAVCLREAEDGWFLANAIDNHAAALARLGRFEAALAGHEEAVRLHDATGNRAAAAATAVNLAGAAHREGDSVRAELMYVRAIEASRAFRYHNTEVEALAGLAGVWVHRGSPDDALAPAHEAMVVAESLRAPALTVLAAAALGEAHLYRGDLQTAGVVLAEAQTLLARTDGAFLRGRVHGLVGECALRQGELERARAALQVAEELFERNDQVLALTINCARRGLVEAHADRAGEARRWLERARATHAPRGEPRHPAVVGALRRLERRLATA